MPFQPIVVTMDEAVRELHNYIVGKRSIVHNSFDRRLRGLDQSMGDPILQVTSQIHTVLRLLNEIRSTAIVQRRYIEQHIRGTVRPAAVPSSRPVLSANRGTNRTLGTTPAPIVRHWLSRDQVRRLLSCLLPYINHRILLNTDSYTDILRIHAENQLITTINANYRDEARRRALNRFSQRLDHIISLLNDVVSGTTLGAAQADDLANRFVQQQPGRPALSLQTLANRIDATTQLLSNRYRNILSSGITIQYARGHSYNPEETIRVADANINNPIDNPLGVIINWNHPDLIPIKYRPNSHSIFQDPIDIMFALAITRFLKYIKATLHVVEVYSEGFIRNPIHLNDPHPFGRSWDVTGFGLNPTAFANTGGNHTPLPLVLHLRGGYPLTNLRGGEHARTNDLLNYRRGPSDWFNIALVYEREYHEELHSGIVLSPLSRSAYLRRIIAVMPRFFGFVKGPGSDIGHMDHFHVDLVRFSSSGPSTHCPATMLNPTPFIPLPAPVPAVRSSSTHRPAQGR